MRCTYCNNQVEDSPNFCPFCGARMPMIPMAENDEPAPYTVTEKEIILDSIPQPVVREETAISENTWIPDEPLPADNTKKSFWDLIGWVVERFIKGYFDFKGRATRFEYWTAMAILGVLIRLAGIFGLGELLSLLVFFPVLSMTSRRLRDAGMNPLLMLLLLLPPVGWLALAVMLCTKSKD